MKEHPEFLGNCPRNVARDAKYRTRSRAARHGGSLVELVYRATDDERWYPTTEDHPELCEMVNAVKMSLDLPPNGAFYINEYRQVVVPTVHSYRYYYAGQYERPLKFEIEGKILSGEALDWDGKPLTPGDTWNGPHPGIPYTLTAGGNDIKYTTKLRPQVEKTVRLSKEIGVARANVFARSIRRVKGFSGGRFYVNEFGTIFAPVSRALSWEYVYIGKLNMEEWFPVPEIPDVVTESEEHVVEDLD